MNLLDMIKEINEDAVEEVRMELDLGYLTPENTSLCQAFVWSESPRGKDFWEDLAEELDKRFGCGGFEDMKREEGIANEQSS